MDTSILKKELIGSLSAEKIVEKQPTYSPEVGEYLMRLRRDKVEKPAIFVGAGTCGLSAGADKIIQIIEEYLKERNVDAEVIQVGCIGLCAEEPLVDIQLPNQARVCFKKVTDKSVVGLLDSVFSKNIPVREALGQHRNDNLTSWEKVPFIDELAFFKPQTRFVLKNAGLIDPSSICEYMANGGYWALAKVIHTMTPAEVCDEVEASGLRGRGGGGFPTGKKWKFAASAKGDQKYVICNADEGDPGAFMDRAIIEGDPHKLLEGLAISAYAVGASKAYIYIRAEYPLAIDRLKDAINQAEELGLIGNSILKTNFDLKVIIKMGAGAFVCGEETALIHSIEGKRGMPSPKPPFPAIEGAFGKPSVVNNVETLANIPSIIQNGKDWFSAKGTEGSKGTKVFALSGNVVNTGLVEVAMGTTVRDIVFAIGGGIPNDRKYKSVQIGGPSGGCIPEEHMDIEIDYESLKTVGAMMGSGGLVVMDEDTCMVDVAMFFMDFIQRESCGKCIPCREGTRRMLEILESITKSRKNEGKDEALKRFKGVMSLDHLASVIQDTALCGLGQSAPKPVMSTLKYFRNEYEAHVFERKCPAKVCQDLLTFDIDQEKCTGCTLCVKNCPADAILGAKKSAHYIVADKCIGCGACKDLCHYDAIIVK